MPRERAGAQVSLQRDQVWVTVGRIESRGQKRIVRMGHLGFVEMMETIAAVTAAHESLSNSLPQ